MADHTQALTAKMLEFCVHYAAHGRAKDAALAAGYSEKSARSRGGRLAKHPLVHAEVQRIRAQVTEGVAYSKTDEERERSLESLEVLHECLMVELDAVIYHDPLALWRAAGFSGDQLAALKALDPLDRRMVSGLKQTHTVRRIGKEVTEETTLELKMRSRDPATMRMARHVGIGNTTKVEVAGPGGGAVQVEHKGLTQVTLNTMITGFLGVPAAMMAKAMGLPAVVDTEGTPA